MPLDIVFDRVGRGYSVTFNRPEVRNALTPAMLAELGEFIGVIERDETAGYLLIRGAGDHSSAGGDTTPHAERLRLQPEQRRREGEGLGILDEVHPPAALDGAVDALLKRLEVAAPRAAQRTKSLLLASETRALEAQMEAEIKVIGQCATEPEFDERIAAFVAKRRPRCGS